MQMDQTARRIIEKARAHAAGKSGPELDAALAESRALLAQADPEVEPQFQMIERALADPDGIPALLAEIEQSGDPHAATLAPVIRALAADPRG